MMPSTPCRRGAATLGLALLGLSFAPAAQAQASAGAFVEATTLDSRALSATEAGARRLFLIDVTGSSAVDLMVVRPPERRSELQAWERRRVGTADQLVADADGALATRVLDIQALYVPGGLAGAGRDLAVLAAEGGAEGATPTLSILRNRGPRSDPRFALCLARFCLL